MTDPTNWADAEWRSDALSSDPDTYHGPDVAAEMEHEAQTRAEREHAARVAWERDRFPVHRSGGAA